MNVNKPGHKEEPLRALLNEWKVTPSLPPSFQERVWRRIVQAEAEPMISVTLWTVWSNWIAEMLKHFFEVSRTMPPDQGKRYLA